MSTMPNLIGMGYLEATAVLVQAGFVVGTTIEVKIKSGPNSTIGAVIGQSVAAGADLVSGSVVNFTVNKPFGQFPASEQNEPIPYWYFLQSGSGGGKVVPVPPPPVVLPLRIGGNWAAGGTSQFSYENLAIFKNRAREGRGFTTTTTPWTAQVALDANGWPTTAFAVPLWEGGILPAWASSASPSTPFKCGFIGSGTPSTATFASCTVANIVMGNGTTTYTTFDLYNVTGVFGFQVSSGAKNIFAYQPAYPGSSIDDITQLSAFTTEGLGIWRNVTMLRDSWLVNATGNGAAMSAATRHSLANCQANQSWTLANTEGYPREWALYLCKYANLGYWPCLPSWDDGVNNSAGSYTLAVLNLINTILIPTGKSVIIELCNEVWNGTPCGVSGALGLRAVANGYATSTGDFTGVYQYFAYLYHQLATMCRTVFGTKFGLGKQVQLVICNQLGGNGTSVFNTMLNYMSANFGSPVADVQLLGLAPYMNLSNNAGDTSTAAVVADLSAQSTITPYMFECEHTSILARHWGLTLSMYEGQWQVNAEATNAFIPPVLASTAITPILVTWAQTCIDAGFQFPFMWFEIGCSQANNGNTPEDELSNNWTALVSTGSPILAAIQTLSNETYTSKRNVISAPADSISGGNFADLQGGMPYSLEVFNNFLPSFTFGVAPAQFYCPVAQTRTLAVNVTGSGTVNIELNGVMIFTAVVLSAGSNTVGSVSLQKGVNYIAIGANTFQGITAVNSVTFN